MIKDASLAHDGTYRIRIRAHIQHAANTGNYTVALYDTKPQVSALELNRIVVGQIDNPYSVQQWTFSANAGQQVRFALVNSTSTGMVFSLTGPNSWSGFTSISGSSDLITLPNSGQYVLTARGNGGRTGAYSCQMQQTSVVDLPLNTVYQGTLAGSSQAQLFRVQVPDNTPLLVTLADTSQADRNELYVRRGLPPTRSVFDFSTTTGQAADRQLLVPQVTPGTWYVLVYGNYVPAASNYVLSVVSSRLELSGVTPSRLGVSAGSPLIVTLMGAGFDKTTTVALVSATNQVYAASSLVVDSFTQVTATFPTVPPGTYTVRVSQPDGDQAELPGGLQILASAKKQFDTKLSLPAALGFHQLATLYVEYANTGDVPIPAPLLVLTATQNGRQGAIMTLDASRITDGFWTSAMPDGFSNTIQFLANGQRPGQLLPGERIKVPVYWAGWQQPWQPGRFEFQVSVVDTENKTPLGRRVQRRPGSPASKLYRSCDVGCLLSARRYSWHSHRKFRRSAHVGHVRRYARSPRGLP